MSAFNASPGAPGSIAATTTIGLPRARRPDDVPPDIPDYRFIKVIGRGAFGTVWLAEEPLAGVFRAIKILDGGGHSRKDRAHLTNRELEGLHAYQTKVQGHPHLIQISKTGLCTIPKSDQWPVDSGQLQNQIGVNADSPPPVPVQTTNHCSLATVYYVMEIADHARGAQPHRPQDYEPLTLAAALRPSRRLIPGEAIDFALQLLDAIEHLHKAGIQHRDIKPSNILFVCGILKLADVGLVSEPGDESIGTTGYLPPDGRPDDLYAFGKVLYEMVTGLSAAAFPEWPGDLDRSFSPANGLLRRERSNSADLILSRIRTLINHLCHPRTELRQKDCKAVLDQLHWCKANAASTVVHGRIGAVAVCVFLFVGVLIGLLLTGGWIDRENPWASRVGLPEYNGAIDFQDLTWNGDIYRLNRYHTPGNLMSIPTSVRTPVQFDDLQTRLFEDGLIIAGVFRIYCKLNPVTGDATNPRGEIDQIFLFVGDQRVLLYNGQPGTSPGTCERFYRKIKFVDLKWKPLQPNAIRFVVMAAVSPTMAERDLDRFPNIALENGIRIGQVNRRPVQETLSSEPKKQ